MNFHVVNCRYLVISAASHYRVFPDAQISAFCRILNANVPHLAWQCAQMGAIFHFLRQFGSMSNSGNRRLNLHLVVNCNHPCDIDRFIWFPTQKSAGCDNSRERGTNICGQNMAAPKRLTLFFPSSSQENSTASCAEEEVGQNLSQNEPSTSAEAVSTRKKNMDVF